MWNALSRRKLFKAASGVLAGATLASEAPVAFAAPGAAAKNVAVERAWMALWTPSHTDWSPFDAILADDFTFSSPNGDDHISKAAFKTRCWESNIRLTKGMDVELMIARGDDIFVKYLGHTTSGKTFRNVELHHFRNGQIASIECFFGQMNSFPSGIEPKKS